MNECISICKCNIMYRGYSISHVCNFSYFILYNIKFQSINAKLIRRVESKLRVTIVRAFQNYLIVYENLFNSDSTRKWIGEQDTQKAVNTPVLCVR